MSNSDEKRASSSENDFFDEVPQNQAKEFDVISAGTVEENLPSVEELESNSQLLSSARSVKVSDQILNQSPTPSSQASYTDQLDENFSFANVNSTPELWNRTDRSCSEDAVESPQLNITVTATSVLKDLNTNEPKTNRRNLSPFQENRNADFSSPPDRDLVPAILSFSNSLKKTYTPSPEKRNVDIDEGSTPIKRLKKTPESESGKPESYKSKLSFSGATQTCHKSPTNLQLQELKVELNKESETVNSPSTPSKRKRNSCIESKITDDLCSSHLMSSSSGANTPHESPTNPLSFKGKIADQDVDESTTKRKTLISFQDCGSNVADAAYESQKMEPAQSNLMILNPKSFPLGHLPTPNNSSAASVSHRELGSNFLKERDRKDHNLSYSSTRTLTLDRKLISPPIDLSVGRKLGTHRRSQSDETLTYRNSPDVQEEHHPLNLSQDMLTGSQLNESSKSFSLGMRRIFGSDETLTSKNLSDVLAQQYQSNSLRKFSSKETATLRSLPEISRVSQTTFVVQPLFQQLPSSSALTAPTALTNPREFSSHSPFNQYGITQAHLSDLSSTSRNDPPIEMHGLLSGQASSSRNQLEVESDMNSSNIDERERQTPASSHQPIITAGSSSFGQPSLPTASNEPGVGTSQFESDIVERWSRQRYQPIYMSTFLSSDDTDSMSDSPSPSDVPQSGEADERTSLPGAHAESIDQARSLLLSVLREMMLYNGEDDLWERFQRDFRRTSGSHSQLDAMNLHSNLLCYLANKGYVLWCQNLFTNHERTAETCTKVVYERLLSMVVVTLAFTLREAKTHIFSGFMYTFYEFRRLYKRSVDYGTIINVEDIPDEVSRNRVKERMKKIKSLVLRMLISFQLVLTYVGENSSYELIKGYEQYLSKEDRMFLRSRF